MSPCSAKHSADGNLTTILTELSLRVRFQFVRRSPLAAVPEGVAVSADQRVEVPPEPLPRPPGVLRGRLVLDVPGMGARPAPGAWATAPFLDVAGVTMTWYGVSLSFYFRFDFYAAVQVNLPKPMPASEGVSPWSPGRLTAQPLLKRTDLWVAFIIDKP